MSEAPGEPHVRFARIMMSVAGVGIVAAGVFGALGGEPLMLGTSAVLVAALVLGLARLPQLRGPDIAGAIERALRIGWVTAAALGALAVLGIAGLVAGAGDDFHRTQAHWGGLVLLLAGGGAYIGVYLRTRDEATLTRARMPLVTGICAYTVLVAFRGLGATTPLDWVFAFVPLVFAFLILATGGALPGSRTRWCPSCLRRNASDALHCDGCGFALATRCAACARANERDATYCAGCGAGLFRVVAK